jgi:uncharacterized protein YhjY with autotransporter beta-barrel domain/uncharacterized membrane protein
VRILRLALQAFVLAAAVAVSAATPRAVHAETGLDRILADPDIALPSDFRKLEPENPQDPLFFFSPYSAAWGVSLEGTYAVGATSVSEDTCESLTGDPIACDLIAAVWTPGSGKGTDQPTLLAFARDTTGSLIGSLARAIDAEGTTIVGFEELISCGCGGFIDPMAWTRKGGDWKPFILAPDPNFVPVGVAAGAARGISDDGKNVVGWTGDLDVTLTDVEASLWKRTGSGVTTWTSALRLGVPIGTSSVANGVADTANGTRIVAGWSGDACTICDIISGSDDFINVAFGGTFFPNAVYWKVTSSNQISSAPLKELSSDPLTRSDATAISTDAKTIVGWSDFDFGSFGPLFEAVLWRDSGSGFAAAKPKRLGVFDLPSSVASQAPGAIPLGSVALTVNDDGSAVGGYEVFIDSLPFTLAFLWSAEFSNGKGRYLGDVLEDAGVKIGNWVFYNATGIRTTDDGFVVVGSGCASGELDEGLCGADPAFIVRLGAESGITTPTDQAVSFASLAQAFEQTTVDPSLWALADMAENHRCIRPQDGTAPSPWCLFGFGMAGAFNAESISDGDLFSGDGGIAYYFTPVTSIGASVGGGTTETDLQFGGDYDTENVRYGAYIAHVPDTGFRALGVAVLADVLDIDISRRYPNGEGRSTSSGDTDGTAWGFLGRLGYGFRAGERNLLTPFAQLNYTRSDFDKWSETGGPFPAVFRGVETDATTGRLGLQAETDLSAAWRLYGSAAWVHAFDNDRATVTGTILELFQFSGTAPGDLDDWGEFVAGSRFQLSPRQVLSLSGRVLTEFDDFYALNGRVGYSLIF